MPNYCGTFFLSLDAFLGLNRSSLLLVVDSFFDYFFCIVLFTRPSAYDKRILKPQLASAITGMGYIFGENLGLRSQIFLVLSILIIPKYIVLNFRQNQLRPMSFVSQGGDCALGYLRLVLIFLIPNFIFLSTRIWKGKVESNASHGGMMKQKIEWFLFVIFHFFLDFLMLSTQIDTVFARWSAP